MNWGWDWNPRFWVWDRVSTNDGYSEVVCHFWGPLTWCSREDDRHGV